MASAAGQRKSLIIFRNPPRLKVQADNVEKFDIVCDARKEVLLKWEGVNYLLGEEEKNDCCITYTNTKKEEEIARFINSSLPETSSNSDGVVLDYSFKASIHSSSESISMAEDHSQSNEDISREKDAFHASVSDVSLEEIPETIETVLHQNQCPAAMKTSQDNYARQSTSTDIMKCRKRSDCIESPSNNSMVMYEPPIFPYNHCKNIRRSTRCIDGKLEIEPLCRVGTGKVNILVFVLQVILERTVRLKNGNYVQFAALYVADKSLEYVKVTLWHDSKNWIRSIDIGCIIVITDVMQHAWKSQISVATTFSSHMFDFCHAKNYSSDLWSEVISKETLNSFILQMEKKYPSIYKGISHLPSIQKAQNIEAFDNLIPGSLVNVVAVVLSISIESAKEKDEFQHPVARIGLQDQTGRKIRLSIWQNQSSILSILRRNHGSWLKFARLAVQTTSTGTDLELHSISDTVVAGLPEQLSEYSSQEKRKRTCFEERITGSIRSIEFIDKKGNTFTLSQKILNEVSSNSSQLLKNETCDSFAYLGNFVYTACLYCFSELELLGNGEYQGCKRCIKMSWKYSFKQTDVLRPFKLEIDCENLESLTVTVFPNDFNRLKAKAPLKNIMEISKSAKETSKAAFDLKDGISTIFKPRKFIFYVSREDFYNSDSLTREEICQLKDVEEFKE